MKCKISDKKILTIILVIFGILVLIPVIYFLVLPFFEKEKPSPITTKEARQEDIPTSQNFDEVILQLNTSQKLVDYLNSNFQLELEEEKQEKPRNPEQFFGEKKGTQWDFAIFTSYVLWKNKYDAVVIRYKYNSDKINVVVVFRDTDLPKTIIFTPDGVSIYPHGWSFAEMFQKEEKRLGIQITEYAISYWTDNGELWPENWTKREF